MDEGYEKIYDLKYSIVLLGDSKAGKQQLINRYAKNQYGGVFMTTVGIDFQDKIIEIEDKKVKLQIWNSAERFRNVAKSYLESTQGFLLVYDITDKESFEKLDFWMELIKNNSQKNIKLVLVGNNCDLSDKRQVSIEEGEAFAKKNNMKFFEASPKDGTNVNELFYYLANEIYQDKSISNDINNKKTSKLTEKSGKKTAKKKCLIF